MWYDTIRSQSVKITSLFKTFRYCQWKILTTENIWPTQPLHYTKLHSSDSTLCFLTFVSVSTNCYRATKEKQKRNNLTLNCRHIPEKVQLLYLRYYLPIATNWSEVFIGAVVCQRMSGRRYFVKCSCLEDINFGKVTIYVWTLPVSLFIKLAIYR